MYSLLKKKCELSKQYLITFEDLKIKKNNKPQLNSVLSVLLVFLKLQ